MPRQKGRAIEKVEAKSNLHHPEEIHFEPSFLVLNVDAI